MVEARTRLEELEENTKKQVEDTVGQLFRSHKEAVGNKKLTISTVEDMMLEARAETERILKNVMPAMTAEAKKT